MTDLQDIKKALHRLNKRKIEALPVKVYVTMSYNDKHNYIKLNEPWIIEEAETLIKHLSNIKYTASNSSLLDRLKNNAWRIIELVQ